jgi:hypothetical protein
MLDPVGQWNALDGESVGTVQQMIAIRWNSMKTLIAPSRKLDGSNFPALALQLRLASVDPALAKDSSA